jgi:hypothetical protein
MEKGDLAMVMSLAEHGTLAQHGPFAEDDVAKPDLTTEAGQLAHAEARKKKDDEFLQKLEKFKNCDVKKDRAVRDRNDEKQFADVLIAVSKLHAKKIVHNDIKPENILVGKGGNIQIADLGTGQTKVNGLPPRIDNMNCQAPEARAAFLKWEALTNQLEKLERSLEGKLAKDIKKAPQGSEDRKKALAAQQKAILDCGNLQAEIRKLETEGIDLTKVDCWAIACTRYRQHTGVYPFVRKSSTFLVEQEKFDKKEIDDFFEMTYEARKNYLFGNEIGNKVPECERDAILNWLDKDPSVRKDPAEGLADIRKVDDTYGRGIRRTHRATLSGAISTGALSTGAIATGG